MSLQLNRAREQPLDICLYFITESSALPLYYGVIQSKLFSLAFSRARQWRDVQISGNAKEVSLQFRGNNWATPEDQHRTWKIVLEILNLGQKENNGMSQLRHLTLDTGDFDEDWNTFSIMSISEHDDALCAMAYSRCFIELDALQTDWGLSRLEKLALWNFGIPDTIPLKQSSMDRLLEISSTQNLAIVFGWG